MRDFSESNVRSGLDAMLMEALRTGYTRRGLMCLPHASDHLERDASRYFRDERTKAQDRGAEDCLRASFRAAARTE